MIRLWLLLLIVGPLLTVSVYWSGPGVQIWWTEYDPQASRVCFEKTMYEQRIFLDCKDETTGTHALTFGVGPSMDWAYRAQIDEDYWISTFRKDGVLLEKHGPYHLGLRKTWLPIIVPLLASLL